MKKLLIWDGDNTLWQGLLMAGNAVLPEGRLEYCQSLYERGVLQSLASFNPIAAVENFLHANGLTQYFLVPKASLTGFKSAMIADIKAELGLTNNEDIVFVDDEQFNRQEVASHFPGLLTQRPEALDAIRTYYFTKDSYTDEDRNRVRMYKADEVRKASGQAYTGDRQEFLRSCEMRMEVFKPLYTDKARVNDLIVKANRMAAISKYMRVPDLWAMRASDKYGDYGLSGVIGIANKIIHLLVISCRLQGMGYGSAFLGTIINKYVGESVYADWLATEYNAGVKSLYEWYDFTIIEDEEDNGLMAFKIVTEPLKLPDWIEIAEL